MNPGALEPFAQLIGRRTIQKNPGLFKPLYFPMGSTAAFSHWSVMRRAVARKNAATRPTRPIKTIGFTWGQARSMAWQHLKKS